MNAMWPTPEEKQKAITTDFLPFACRIEGELRRSQAFAFEVSLIYISCLPKDLESANLILSGSFIDQDAFYSARKIGMAQWLAPYLTEKEIETQCHWIRSIISQSYTSKEKPIFGIASRRGRILDAAQLSTEAQEAMLAAQIAGNALSFFHS